MSDIHPPLKTQFLSHAEYASDCARAAALHQRLRQFVQADINGSTECGLIRDAWTTPKPRYSPAIDMWTVEVIDGPNKGRHHVPVHKVRRCSGLDGHCNCAKEN